jgi:hypothetical protein
VLGALAVLVLLLLWRALPRLGPMLPDPGPAGGACSTIWVRAGNSCGPRAGAARWRRPRARRAMIEVGRQYPHVPLMPEPSRPASWPSATALAPALAQQLVQAALPDRQAPAMIQLARACAEIHQRGAHPRAVPERPN